MASYLSHNLPARLLKSLGCLSAGDVAEFTHELHCDHDLLKGRSGR
jgi:hypothetical protein